MKIKQLLSKASIATLLLSILSPLSMVAPRVSAAADTCVWTGGGTPTVDAIAKTISYDVTEAANWSVCDNSFVPEAGDILEFPANMADVDPGDTLTDDSVWKYVVNNDLAANTNIAGILFTGDKGATCVAGSFDDGYVLSGNSISLSDNVEDSTTNYGCSSFRSQLDMDITTTVNVAVDVEVTDSVAPVGVNEINFGANELSFCRVGDAGRLTKYFNQSYNTKLTGTGILRLACEATYFYGLTSDSTFGNVIAESGTSITGSTTLFGSSETRTLTFKDGATFGFSEDSSTGDVEFKSALVFVGDGIDSNYCTSTDYANDCGSGKPENVVVTGYRGSVSNSKNNYPDPATYYKSTFTGPITFSSDTIIQAQSDVTLTGALTGNFKVGLFPGSRGSLTLNGSSNSTATANGVIKPIVIEQKLKNVTSDLYYYYGYNAVLSKDNDVAFKIEIHDGAKLKGEGKIAGIDIKTGGILAPGNSPGCIVSTSGLTLAGTFEAEIASTTACTGYDQTDVTGTVNITGGTLTTTFLSSFVPKANDTFTIIKNDAADAVTGTFTGKADDSRFDVAGVTFEINYNGGDGNDVVLTAVSVPASATTPDTGIGSALSSPFATMFVMLLAGGSLYGSRKINSLKK